MPESGAEGVIVAQGGVTGGHTLYAKGGVPKYCYNFFGLERYYAEGTAPIPPGTHQVRMEFDDDGGGLGKGGTATLYIDGESVGSGRIEQTEAFLFSADETCDVGDEFGSPVTALCTSQKRFSGEVGWVEIELGLDNHNHLIRPRPDQPGDGLPVGAGGRSARSRSPAPGRTGPRACQPLGAPLGAPGRQGVEERLGVGAPASRSRCTAGTKR